MSFASKCQISIISCRRTPSDDHGRRPASNSATNVVHKLCNQQRQRRSDFDIAVNMNTVT